jgi:hypothetical protein
VKRWTAQARTRGPVQGDGSGSFMRAGNDAGGGGVPRANNPCGSETAHPPGAFGRA